MFGVRLEDRCIAQMVNCHCDLMRNGRVDFLVLPRKPSPDYMR